MIPRRSDVIANLNNPASGGVCRVGMVVYSLTNKHPESVVEARKDVGLFKRGGNPFAYVRLPGKEVGLPVKDTTFPVSAAETFEAMEYDVVDLARVLQRIRL